MDGRELPIVADNDWDAAIALAAIHVRVVFRKQPGRCFVPSLVINQNTTEAILCIYHHSGMTSTPRMNVETKHGFEEFINVVVGVLSWKNPAEAGEDPLRTSTSVVIPRTPFIGEIVNPPLC